MQKKMLPEAEQYTKQNRRRRVWQQIVRTLACIVVFCTTYALILPAITMERECEIEEHTHTVECYQQITSIETRTMVCTVGASGEKVLHQHGEYCYDGDGVLICTLAELEAHTHTTECYTAAETEAAHVHDSSCYQLVRGIQLCTLSETAGHTHGDSCYTTACTLEETAGHSHSASCYTETTTQTCGLEESAGHTHGDGCYTQTSTNVCGMEESAEHTHAAECYITESVLSCTVVETAGHTHTDACYTTQSALTCGQEETEAHTHVESCLVKTLTCTLEEVEGHTHTTECFQMLEELVCTLSTETIASEAVEQVLTCGKDELEAHTHGEGCYDGETLTCGKQQVLSHSHTDACIHTETTELDTETLTCTLPEDETHTHWEICYGNWKLLCEKQEHTHTEECDALLALSEEDRALVEEVIALIDAIPSADEIDEKIAEFEAIEDYEGEEAWLEQVYQEVAKAYYYYDLLTEELKAYVSNADKLLELEYIWSVTPYAITTSSPTIYQINSYVDPNSDKSVMVFGGTVSEKVQYKFLWWYAVKVEKDSEGYYRVVEILSPSLTSDKSNYEASASGFILLFYHTDTIPDASVGDYVTVNFTIPSSGVYKSSGYGTVTFSSAKSTITSAAPTTTWYTSTKEFIELNLYDYNGYVNADYWTKNNWYPGFQWNGGAYSNDSGDNDYNDYREAYSYDGRGIPYAFTDRNVVDSIDFGNSLITNLTYGGGSNGDYTKAVNATSVGKVANSTAASSTGQINWLYGNSTEGYTNKPIGTSTTDASYDDVMKDTLVEGYPALVDGTMLDYLFKAGTAVTKMNTESIDGLFQRDETTGKYEYNSREHHAQYSNNFFQLYNQIITPNFITYPFGNFLPLNTISDSSKATQVGAFNYVGGMYDYVERTIDDLKNDTEGLGSYWNGTQSQLVTMLEEYAENWMLYPRTINSVSNNWLNLSPANAIRDYFWGDTAGAGDKPSSNTDFITQDFLNNMYNIDWDVQTNFFFGMEMKMNFYQPKGGLTGPKYDQPMEFNFTGDDDVWVYVDGVLFLDLSGIHRHVGGQIDFVNGKVHYYALTPSTGDVSSTPYKTFTFAEILTAAGQSTSGLNSKGTFADYSSHTFNFYYMERGSGSSVCRLNFNFPLLRQNTISVEKALADDDSNAAIDALGNPDFLFQVLKPDGTLFTGENWAYSLYDADGSVIQEIKVTSQYPDGRVQEMSIYDSAGNKLCTELYDSDGKMTSQTGSGLDKVLRTDDNGIFALKAGQKAEFVGISEKMGSYFVRELLEESVASQYGTITVDGTVVTPSDVTVGGTSYSGADSPEMNIGSGSTIFRIENKITLDQLAELSITKKLEAVTDDVSADTLYKMNVTLDGTKLPVGTSYTVTDGTTTTTKTVATEGVIEIKAGETATISNILAGTQFVISEDSESAKGFSVVYTQTGASADEVEATAESITGIVHVNTTVAVTVTNTEEAVKLAIPVTKQYYKHGSANRTSTFQLVQVSDATGKTVVTSNNITPADGAAITVGNAAMTDEELFTLVYRSIDGITYNENGQAVFYYRLTEDNSNLPNNALKNNQVYIYEVTVTKSGSTMTAAITGMWSGTADDNGTPTGTLTKLDSISTATFTNTIAGPLTISKQVEGSSVAKEKEYQFTITLDTSAAGNAPLAENYSATRTTTAEDGTETTEDITLSFTGTDTKKSATVTLKHGQSVVINDIPYNTTWTVKETTPENMIVSYVVYTETTVGDTVEGESASGTIKLGSQNEVSVVFTNTSTYALPETGGAGTTSYTMAGLVLMLYSAAFLLYRYQKRRREGF